MLEGHYSNVTGYMYGKWTNLITASRKCQLIAGTWDNLVHRDTVYEGSFPSFLVW